MTILFNGDYFPYIPLAKNLHIPFILPQIAVGMNLTNLQG